MWQLVRAGLRSATGPICGLIATYAAFVLTGWGRALNASAFHGRVITGGRVQSAELTLLGTISTASVLLALVTLVAVAGLRGRWWLGLRCAGAVLGALLSAELVKILAPSTGSYGQWHWLRDGSFPSGHTAIVASLALAVLSVSSDAVRRWLIGPLVAVTAIATTATVTVGWHQPADVLGSLFIAMAWHRAVHADPGVAEEPGGRARAVAFAILACGWLAASVIVLGPAVAGLLLRPLLPRGDGLAYTGSMLVLLLGTGITIVAAVAPFPLQSPSFVRNRRYRT